MELRNGPPRLRPYRARLPPVVHFALCQSFSFLRLFTLHFAFIAYFCTMNQLTLYESLWVYEGRSQRKREHGHPAIQLFLSPDEPFRLDFPGEQVECRACIVNALHPRLCDHEGVAIVLFNVEYETLASVRLKNAYLGERPYCVLDDSLAERLIALYQAGEWRSDPLRILEALLPADEVPPRDLRITRVLDYLKGDVECLYNTAELARLACLSESHFLHLFKEQMRIPVRKYLQWRRMRQALILLGQGKSLTEAALLCGFADLSHFNRTFQKMFGLPPSRVLQKSSFVQVQVAHAG